MIAYGWTGPQYVGTIGLGLNLTLWEWLCCGASIT